MSISTQLSRIQHDRDVIRAKLVELGLATNTDNLDVLATAIDNIVDQGAVSVEIMEGTSYTIPKGYHNGSGVVKAITDTAGEAEKYKVQAKVITPTKSQVNVTPDQGYYALESVTVNAIPDAYQDVTGVTALAEDVLVGKVFVAADGTVVTGSMANNADAEVILSGTTLTYTIPKGYHSGNSTVSIVLENRTVTPSEEVQEITAADGKVLGTVTVNPIPADYVANKTSDATATEGQILDGATAYVNGVKVTGTMANNGKVTETLNVTKTTVAIPQGYHDGTGSVSIVTETKTATPTKEEQKIAATSGKVLSEVTINPIPAAYQDVTKVTLTDDKALEGYKFVDAEGNVVEGTMRDNPDVTQTLDTTTKEYAIPQGYHSGEGKVKIVTEEKTFTPTREGTVIEAVGGKVISKVTVAGIPDEYQVVTAVDVEADEVLEGKKFVAADGTVVTGTMANNGAVNHTLDAGTEGNQEFAIPQGYHDGTGKVKVVVEAKDTVVPTKEAQKVTATAGKVLNEVNVAPIPDAYQDVTGVTTTAEKVLVGSKFVDNKGAVVEGTMANNGDVSATMTGLTDEDVSVTIPAGYTRGGTISLTKDIENLLAAI